MSKVVHYEPAICHTFVSLEKFTESTWCTRMNCVSQEGKGKCIMKSYAKVPEHFYLLYQRISFIKHQVN